MPVEAPRPVRFGNKLALVVGFGGMLALVVLAGFHSLQILKRAQRTHSEITGEYLQRHHLLDRVRSSVYLAGGEARDYLMDPQPASAAAHRTALLNFKSEIASALTQYASSDVQGRHLVTELQSEIGGFWQALDPALRWDADQRRAHGYEFLQSQIFPRREVMLRIAARIDAVNEHIFDDGDRQWAELFSELRTRVYALLFIITGMGVLLAMLTINHTLVLQRESRRRYEDSARARAELQKLSARLVQAQEDERRTISRELHDEIGQSLSALLLDLGNMAAIAENQDEGYRRMLQDARKMVENSLNAVRNMALLLRPSMLDDFGLIPALNWQAKEISRRMPIRVTVTAEEAADGLPEEYRTCVYRLVQEALTNCCRHSGAAAVRINIRQERKDLLLSIEDNGKGFDTALHRGLGLVGMEERVKHFGGALEIDSAPGRGTLIRVRLPLQDHGGISTIKASA